VTIARQLGLEPTTVGNFFMNARRRSMDKWKEETDGGSGPIHKGSGGGGSGTGGNSNSSAASSSPASTLSGQSVVHTSQAQHTLGAVHVAQVVTVHHTPDTIMTQHNSAGASLDNNDANL